LKKLVSLLFIAILVVSLLFPALAMADQQQVDNDIASPGNQNILNLTAAPGAIINTSGQITVTRSSGGNHLSAGDPLDFVVTPSQTTLPVGYSVSSVSGTIPSTWDTDPNGTVYAVGWSDITFTAPATPGNYSYVVKWEETHNYGNKLTGGDALVINLAVGGVGMAYVTFDQTGVGVDFTGTVLTVDATNYGVNDLPKTFSWEVDSEHTFAYLSPLVVDAGKQYVWTDTTGLTTDQNGTLTVPDDGGAVTGNYKTQYLVSFEQMGSGAAPTVEYTADTDPTGTVPFSVWVKADTEISYTYQAIVDGDPGVRYVLTGVSPESPQTVTGPLTVTGTYKTQYYLTLVTSPALLTTPSGEGWYDAGTSANISTTSPVASTPYTYFFAGWTTDDMAEIANQYALSTTVLMDKAKTVIANYQKMQPATGGKSIGFWSNKNGQALLLAGDATFLNGLGPYNSTSYPKKPSGYPPFSTTLATFKTQVNGYLLNANAVDMRYMLAAQLLSTELSVKKGFLSASQEVWVDDGDLIVKPGEVMTIGNIMANAITQWSSGTRATQEYYKNLLDKINNNQLWFLAP